MYFVSALIMKIIRSVDTKMKVIRGVDTEYESIYGVGWRCQDVSLDE